MMVDLKAGQVSELEGVNSNDVEVIIPGAVTDIGWCSAVVG